MPKGDDTARVVVYPPDEDAERWDRLAGDMGYGSRSRFVQAMVEAGIKAVDGFEATVQPDETAAEIRVQRNDLLDENERLRARVSRLERERAAERDAVENYITARPNGVSYGAVVDHVKDTAFERVREHVQAMFGEQVQAFVDEDGLGRLYPAEPPEDVDWSCTRCGGEHPPGTRCPDDRAGREPPDIGGEA